MATSTSGNPSQALSKGFKRPSEKALKHGNARNLLLDMVHRAESKLMKMKEDTHSQAGADVRMQDIAEELFHKPGTLLTQEEFARIFQESDCASLVEEPSNCDFVSVHTYRTYDGTCNNLNSKTLGASSTKFRRLIPPSYEDGCDSPIGRLQREFSSSSPIMGPFTPPNPSARKLSSDIVGSVDTTENPFTHIVMQWGQFLDHDMDLGPEPHVTCETCDLVDNTCEPIKIEMSDSVFHEKGSTTDGLCLSFVRSLAVCEDSDMTYGVNPREQVNDVTSPIDGSMVYGSTEAIADDLAEHDGDKKTGLMLTSDGGLNLPIVSDPANANVICMTGDCYNAGDIRVNEQAGLVSMHTLLVREHNRIANRLMSLNPHWSGERIYQESRKIVGAEIQKITYSDYLPKVLGQNVFDIVIGSYAGYVDDADLSVPNAFATAAYRYGHSLVNPVFTRYLSDDYELGSISNLHLINSFFNKTAYTEYGLESILRGLVSQHALRMDDSMNLELTTQLFFNAATGKGLDLASLNIQRQRDHGMPKYGIWKNFCQKMFPTLPRGEIEKPLTVGRLLMNYGTVDNSDLWLAGISEERLDGSLIGPTFACIFGLTFKNSRDGDRFYYENTDVGNEEGTSVFSPEQVTAIKESTLAGMICDNTNIEFIQADVFMDNSQEGNSREECSNIPSLDLSQWEEEPCYVRIDTDDVPDGASVVTFFNTYIQQHTTTEIASDDDDHICTAIACPPYKRLRVRVFGNGAANNCEATANDGLPEDKNDKLNVYASNTAINEDVLDADYGIYRSRQKCNRDDAEAAVTFSCGSNVASSSSHANKVTDCENVVDVAACRTNTIEEQNTPGSLKPLHESAAFEEEMELLKELKEKFEG